MRLPSVSYSFLIAGLIAAGLSGCATTTQVVADDPRVFLPSLRASVSLEDNPQHPADPQSGRAIEFEATKAKGSGEQTLVASQPPVIFNGTTFTPPQQLRNDFDFNYVDASFRWRKFFRERALGLEVSGGVAHTSVGLTVTSPTQSASQHFGNWGAQGGVALIWRMHPGTSLHARISGFVSRADNGVRDLGRYELFLAQSLGDNLALRAGYAKWEVNGDSPVGQSDFRMTFSGPTVDLGLNF